MRSALAVLVLCAIGCASDPFRRSVAPSRTPERPGTPKCDWIEKLKPMPLNATADAPAGASPEQVFVAARKFFNQAGTDLATIDHGALAFATEPIGGQTLMTTCGVNEHRVYIARLAVVASTVMVTLECRYLLGSEHPYWRGELRDCELSPVAAADAEMARLLAEGVVKIADVERMQRAH